ncbi:MAG: hypothetical protein QGG36_32970 [Pirellulaceae bacterium]|nr:hypothetical protein [Pirellulaceae bacterium]
MISIWQVLVQFAFRLSFGVALSMGLTPPKLVTSGFYRVHLWVLMGINTVAALAVWTDRDAFAAAKTPWVMVMSLAIGIAVASYAGAVCWLYENAKAGGLALFIVALGSLMASAFATPWTSATGPGGVILAFLELISSGMLLGATMSAMLLGHWYLNTPTMALAPLKRLVQMMIGAVAIRTVLCAIGLAVHLSGDSPIQAHFGTLLAFRWLAGLLGVSMMGMLAWHTLKVPNTQSATGILYAGVILAFIGELVSQLLLVDRLYPL